jgi:ubiquinone/menaquinone biosynthesis C-methylase UbiE
MSAAARPTNSDTVLDVCCGPGIVVCAFAPHVRQATGLDFTPVMLDRARALAAEHGLRNVALDQGDAYALPYPDGSFTIVVTRYSLHHLDDPAAALREMVRVCAPGDASSWPTPMRRRTRCRRPLIIGSKCCATPLMPVH